MLCWGPDIGRKGDAVAGLFLGALRGAALPPDLVPRGLAANGATKEDGARIAADIISQVQALGDEAMKSFFTSQSYLVPKVGSFIIQRFEAF